MNCGKNFSNRRNVRKILMPEEPNISESMTPHPAKIENLHRFKHEAMNTIFDIFIVHPDGRYAGQAAWEAFLLLDRLGQDLSRFIENSDISQLIAAAPGQRIRLTLPAFECLVAAKSASEQTGGAFDITVGALIRCWRNEDYSPRTPSQQEIEDAKSKIGWRHLHLFDDISACVDCPGLRIDLGAIGKGFAIDQMAELLKEWEIETAMLSSGGSTIRALSRPPGMAGWPVSVSDPLNRQKILEMLTLADCALSCSGIEKGPHIIDPRTGRPAADRLSAWSLVPDATAADALSTAFLIMPPAEIEMFCKNHPPTAAMIYAPASKTNPIPKLTRFGPWDRIKKNGDK
jgi:FAD:protein FMN transferase